jgi:hypothetical protein
VDTTNISVFHGVPSLLTRYTKYEQYDHLTPTATRLQNVIQCVRKVIVHLGYGKYVDYIVSIEVAVEVCCCYTVFSC